MNYLTVEEIANKWGLSARSVRNYCNQGRVRGAYLNGKTWLIPENAAKPGKANEFLSILRQEKQARQKGGIYHKVQVDFAYNSNHMEGNTLTHDQTRYIYETNTISFDGSMSVSVSDVMEIANHFRCVDMVIDNTDEPLSEKLIKSLHYTLKTGTMDETNRYAIGDYKNWPNVAGDRETAQPEEVGALMKQLMKDYSNKRKKEIDDILEFHYRFECIHPFQDGNGRIGRLIMFRECLRYNIIPFIITDDFRWYYIRGLKQWTQERGFLRDTCLMAQDQFKKYLDYFRIPY